LPRAALLVACEEYPGLEPRDYLERLDSLAATLLDRLGAETQPERQIAALNTLLFEEHGFRGATANYYDPRNSYLNEVLDRRLGIPLTLSLLYVAVGRRCALPLSGVGFPSHFLVAYEAEPRLYIDPFNCGRLVSVEELQRMLFDMFGKSAKLEPSHLMRTRPRQILERLVTNLKTAYERSGDTGRARRAADQLSAVLRSIELRLRRN